MANARRRERERVARELHDTVLQSAQGLILQLHSVVHGLADCDPRHAQLLRAVRDAEALLAEGHERIFGLRTWDRKTPDLPTTLRSVVSALGAAQGSAVHTVVTGEARSLQPRIGDAVLQIGREATRNAVRHGNAAVIEIGIDFAPRTFCLRVRDNGVGIDPRRSAARATPGHWGLLGMAERARAIGARLSIRSQPGRGTELELAIPGRTAYLPGEARGEP